MCVAGRHSEGRVWGGRVWSSSAFKTPSSDKGGRMGENDWIIGVSFSFASSVLSCLGLIFQKYAHNQNQALPDDKKYPVILGIVCSPCWWASFIMMGLFPFPFDFFAYSFAAQSLVAPFAGLTLIMNQFFAPIILKEKLYRIDILASIVVFVGTTMTTVTGNHDDESYTLDDLLGYFKRTEFVIGALLLTSIMILMLLSLKVTDPLKQGKGANEKKNTAKGNPEAKHAASSETNLADVHLSLGGETPSTETGAQTSFVLAQGGVQAATSPRPSDVRSIEPVSSLANPPKHASMKRKRHSGKAVSFLRNANFSARPFYYGFVSGGFGALQNIFFKSAGVLMKTSVFDGGESAWTTWYPYVFLITVAVLAILQLSFLNKGMSRYDAVLVFPLYNASYIFLSVSMGALYFGEFATFSTTQAILFPVGVVITLLGIIMFIFKPRDSMSEQGKSQENADGDEAQEAEANDSNGLPESGGSAVALV